MINEDSQELLALDDLVKKLLRAEKKAKIQNNYELDQRCHRGKRLLKLIKETHMMTTSLKKLKNLVRAPIVRANKRLTITPNKELRSLKSLRSPKRLKKKKAELEKKARTTRRQHFDLRNKYNSSKKVE